MRLKLSRFCITFLILTVLTLNGCANQSSISNNAINSAVAAATSQAVASNPQSTKTEDGEEKIANNTKKEVIPGMNNIPRLEGKATVVMTVKGSPITIEVDGNNAPITAGNFVDLVQRGVYDGLVFHRVVREPQPFVVQGGDPQGKDEKFPIQRLGTGSFIDPETKNVRYVPLEIKPKGAAEPIYGKTFKEAKISQPPELNHKLGAVAMARSQLPNSASSQFYFALTELGFLDGDYAVFGYVTEGMDVVNKIQQGDRIDSAKVTEGAENLKKPNE